MTIFRSNYIAFPGAAHSARIHASNGNCTVDDGRDDKDPDPEGVAVATAKGRPYLFLQGPGLPGVPNFTRVTPFGPPKVHLLKMSVAPPRIPTSSAPGSGWSRGS